MTGKLRIAIVCMLSALLIVPCVPHITAHANSAQTYWSGRDAFGAYITGENCSVVVDSEILTLRAPHFPKEYYESLSDIDGYEANVTAEYTFYNPADYGVEMTLAFPFGKTPDYFYGYYDFETSSHVYYDDTVRYSITADGEEIERIVRHTLNSPKFDAQTDIARLADDMRSCGIFTPQTPIYTYTYDYEIPIGGAKNPYIAADFYGLGDSEKTCIVLEKVNIYQTVGNKELCGIYARDGLGTFRIWIIGELPDKMPEWKVYADSSLKKTAEGEVRLSTKSSSTKTTFADLAMTTFDEDSGVSETDWYNAVLDNFLTYRDNYGKGSSLVYYGGMTTLIDVSRNLMRWYEYNLYVPAGGKVVNSVTAPLYPSIDLDWEKPEYTYTYLLSPASTWADFGSFEARIITPYYLVDGSLPFENIYADDIAAGAEVENCFVYSQQGLPEGELTFVLSESEFPVKIKRPGSVFYGFLFIGVPIILTLSAVATVVAIVLIIVIVCRKIRRK